jgi:hypothetical protein
MSDILTVIEWTTIPDAAFSERGRAPLYVNRENWGHTSGEGWNAQLGARYDGHPGARVELAVIHAEEGGRVGYIADVTQLRNGKLDFVRQVTDIEPYRQFFPTLHGAMKAAEEYAAEVCSRIPVETLA